MKLIAVGVMAMMALVIAAFSSKPASAEATNEAVPVAQQAQPAETEQDEEKFVYIEMKTSLGDIYLELNNEKAPITTENFVRYTEEGFYNGTIFHRVIPGFMIQGGGFTSEMRKKETHDGIKNEWKNGLKNVRGSIAMARLGGQPDSATAQFFINVTDNDFLDQPNPRSPNDNAAYAVFGKVVKGMDAVDKIRDVRTTTKGPYANVPVEAVEITEVSVLTKEKAEELELVEAAG